MSCEGGLRFYVVGFGSGSYRGRMFTHKFTTMILAAAAIAGPVVTFPAVAHAEPTPAIDSAGDGVRMATFIARFAICDGGPYKGATARWMRGVNPGRDVSLDCGDNENDRVVFTLRSGTGGHEPSRLIPKEISGWGHAHIIKRSTRGVAQVQGAHQAALNVLNTGEWEKAFGDGPRFSNGSTHVYARPYVDASQKQRVLCIVAGANDFIFTQSSTSQFHGKNYGTTGVVTAYAPEGKDVNVCKLL